LRGSIGLDGWVEKPPKGVKKLGPKKGAKSPDVSEKKALKGPGREWAIF